ncbi:TetR/AcrR family transcriptional regulator [Amycolatopsis ultiminotia]|uniref:TetR/AcrR family transcriptional regulator n=1 Tax=Amycolatopsis ultiminotia TaxID=543629 RepID=UPI003CD07FB0
MCRAAGISSGSLFHYFPGKRAVFAGLVRRNDDRMRAGLAELVERGTRKGGRHRCCPRPTRQLLDRFLCPVGAPVRPAGGISEDERG